MQDIQDILTLGEGLLVEFKKASDTLPLSLWETYSAFANSEGGTIVLGVSEINKKLVVTGVKDPSQQVKLLWDLLNNKKKVSDNLLSERHIYIQSVEEKEVIVMEVPRADRHDKPVYINNDLMGGTYRRNGEGDYRCTSIEVKAMLRDQTDTPIDGAIIKELDWKNLDKDCISRYRNRFSSLKPAHVWNELATDEFLQKIGAAKRSEQEIKPTLAGLLMFGTEDIITQTLPDYFLDYREIFDNRRWSDRVVSNLGEWSGNIFDFFFKVLGKLTSDIKAPFQLRNGIDRVDETEVHTALREALANTLIHADYYGRRGIVIEKGKHKIVLANPGILRLSVADALAGGVSDPRNPTIFKMFALLDIGERAGSGLFSIRAIWKELGWVEPVLQETFNPDRTTLTIEVEFEDTTQETGGTTQEIEDTTQETGGTTQEIEDTTQETGGTTPKTEGTTQEKILQAIMGNPKITRKELAAIVRLTPDGVKYHLRQLTNKGIIKHIGTTKSGEWVIFSDKNAMQENG